MLTKPAKKFCLRTKRRKRPLRILKIVGSLLPFCVAHFFALAQSPLPFPLPDLMRDWATCKESVGYVDTKTEADERIKSAELKQKSVADLVGEAVHSGDFKKLRDKYGKWTVDRKRKRFPEAEVAYVSAREALTLLACYGQASTFKEFASAGDDDPESMTNPLTVALGLGRCISPELTKWALEQSISDGRVLRISRARSAIGRAIALGQLDLAQSTIEALHGGNADVSKIASDTLPRAACSDRVKLVQDLLDRGADPDKGICSAVASGQVTMTDLFLKNGAKARCLGAAAATGNPELTSHLLKAGADANTGVYYAILRRQPAILELLLSSGADPNRQVPIDIKGRSGLGPDFDTMFRNSPNAVVVINGVRVQKPTDVHYDEGPTPLYWAIQNGDLDSVAILLKHGADRAKSFQVRNDQTAEYQLLTPTEFACRTNKIEICRALSN